MVKKVDVLIIGGGPGGMYASIIGSLINISSAIIETNPFLGGQPMQLYAEKNIHDFPGFKEILPAELINGMIEQINNLKNKPEVFLDTNIKNINKEKEKFITKLNNNKIIESNYIVIATGSGSFYPVKNEILSNVNYENIHYIFGDVNLYKNKKILILGGGDSALDWCIFLKEKKITNDVILIHRRENFKAREDKIYKINNLKIKKFLDYKIIDILKKEIIIECNKKFKKEKINYDFIIVQYGQEIKINNEINLFKDIERNQNNKIIIDINCKTNIENIYAIGNSNYFDSKPNLIISACSEGARAMYHIRSKKIKK